jgi:FkbM family methyltransferase
MSLAHSFYRVLWRQSWLRPRLRKSVYKKLCARGDQPDFPFSKDFYGLRFEGNLNNSIEFSIYYYDAFEKPLLYFLGDTLHNINSSQPDSDRLTCFCDVGANIGQHSLFMSRLADQVHAFEPFAEVSNRLRRHIKLNQLENVELHRIGLSDATEKLTFYAPTGRNQGIGSFDASTTGKGNQAAGELALARGDEYFEEFPIGRVDLMKIDVEGFESKVLAGLEQTLQQYRPIIVCEVSYSGEMSFDSVESLLQSLPADYALFTFNTRKTDGSKARRRGARARKTGGYELIPCTDWRESGQDDIIACPTEKKSILPMLGTGRIPVP